MEKIEPWLLIFVFIIIMIILMYFHFIRKKTFKIELTWMALALCPILIWLLTTGRLTEFTAFGISAKLRNASESKLITSLDGQRIDTITVRKIEEIDLVNDEKDKTYKWIIVERNTQINNDLVNCLMDACITIENYIFANSENEFLGFISTPDSINSDIEKFEISNYFVKDNNSINIETIFSNNLVIRDKVNEEDSRGDVLRVMIEKNIDRVAIVNDDDEMIGFVERNKVLENIVADLVSR